MKTLKELTTNIIIIVNETIDISCITSREGKKFIKETKIGDKLLIENPIYYYRRKDTNGIKVFKIKITNLRTSKFIKISAGKKSNKFFNSIINFTITDKK